LLEYLIDGVQIGQPDAGEAYGRQSNAGEGSDVVLVCFEQLLSAVGMSSAGCCSGHDWNGWSFDFALIASDLLARCATGTCLNSCSQAASTYVAMSLSLFT